MRPKPLLPCRAVVSGAAGRTGELCSRELAGFGIELVLVDIDRMMVNRLAEQLGATAHGVDVLSDASVRQFMRAIDNRPRCANLLVNAAGASYVRTLGMARMTAAFAKLVLADSVTVLNIASHGSQRDRYKQPAAQMAYHRASESVAAQLKRPETQVLTFGAADEPDLIIDALRQWRALCTGSQPQGWGPGLALAAGGPQ